MAIFALGASFVLGVQFRARRSPRRGGISISVSMSIAICMYVCMYVYIYIYIERERGTLQHNMLYYNIT